ncbi:MAG: radical SAM protein [Candidatus Aureabacteria bacterium]|nr:radical SAM protein [Candidatus Auribacterota bacterium]
MASILFINPPSRRQVYLETNIRVGAPSYPNLTLATLAGHLVKEHKVRVVDLDFSVNPLKDLKAKVLEFKPDVVAASVKTPDYFTVRDLFRAVKKEFPGVKTVAGGVHVSALPEEASGESCFDVLVIGEGDTTLLEWLGQDDKIKTPGMMVRAEDGCMVSSGIRDKMPSLDSLPFPAWHLYELKRYSNSRLSSRKNPVGHLETSRGCAYNCNFCSKIIFGNRFRVKSPERVLDEIEYMLGCGFKEIHIVDDSFTQDIERAKEICRRIIQRNLKFPWSLINGIRVDKVDDEFFQLAKRAGCWQAGFGLETGDQRVLDKVNKRITLAQTEKAVKMASKAGVESFGFFIFALDGETEESMKRTIGFAKSLPLSMAKFDICIPYPGTPFYNDLEKQGRILTKDWSKYNCHQLEEPLFSHLNVSWQTVGYYYKKAFRDFYFRPSYIGKRILRSIKNGDLFHDLKYFLNFKW